MEMAPPRQLRRYPLNGHSRQMNREPHPHRWHRYLVDPKAIIFGICLVNFVAMLVHVYRVDREIKASGYIVGHWYPGAVMVDPFLLIIAGICLMVNRWWSLPVALLLSVRVVYHLGYLSWIAVHHAHDVPMLSWQAADLLWKVVYQPRPQYLFHVLLAMVVFIHAIGLLTRVRFYRRAVSVAGG
jgi:hypothetical protein